MPYTAVVVEVRAAEKEQELHVLQRVSEVNHILVEVDCRPIRLEYATKHSSKFHPMVTEMSCSNAACSNENPYAVVPADASRWGPIVKWLTLWVVLGPCGHAVFPQPLIRQ